MRRTILLWIMACILANPAAAGAQRIHEIRIDQPGADDDEYLELSGPPGLPLGGLTYVVIGDGASALASGVIEAAVDLSGQSIPASGFFVVAEASLRLGTADLVTNLNFENSDNVTHLLVEGFSGASGDDLDLDDDGVLDVVPWTAVIDSIAFVEEANPPTGTEFSYSFGESVGPDGSSVPGHVGRCPDANGDIRILAFDPAAGEDTPGAPNACPPVLAPIPLRIPEIQGPGHISPFVGQPVRTRGIVTAVDSNGYYLQDPTGDGDPATSDALLVFTGGRPEPQVGDDVEIVAEVTEFVPGGASSGNLSITELVNPTETTLLGSAPLPDPVVLGRRGRIPPADVIDDDAFVLFDPAMDGIDFFESLEGMRVTARRARAVVGTNRFGEIFTVVDGGRDATGLSRRGTLNVSPSDFNPERVQVQADEGLLDQALPRVDTGARLGDLTGVVSYSFGNFEILLTELAGEPRGRRLSPERTHLRTGGAGVRVASFNVLNLDPNDDDGDTDVADGRFASLGRIIAHNLRAPEIVALQEIQDNDGSTASDVTAADQTLKLLADAIQEAGGPTYAFVDNPFIGNDTSGGQPGGNIRTAFLYDPEHVSLVSDSLDTPTDPADQQANPQNPFFGARLPLVARFDVRGSILTLINVHLSSKGGSAPLFGQTQPATELQEDPAVNGSLDERTRQTQAISDFVGAILDVDPDAPVAVLGDFNEFEFISPLTLLEDHLTNLTRTLPPDERYTFIFQGNSQSLDHLLISPVLRRHARFDIVHVTSEFAETPTRPSDHDPILARFHLRSAPARPTTR